jgi:hypothetical protein
MAFPTYKDLEIYLLSTISLKLWNPAIDHSPISGILHPNS